uniref:Uncharacterized protein n=1 Tax=Helianthus annuus TaxID=4232 RepID=A0A251T445_HELAN
MTMMYAVDNRFLSFWFGFFLSDTGGGSTRVTVFRQLGERRQFTAGAAVVIWALGSSFSWFVFGSTLFRLRFVLVSSSGQQTVNEVNGGQTVNNGQPQSTRSTSESNSVNNGQSRSKPDPECFSCTLASHVLETTSQNHDKLALHMEVQVTFSETMARLE